MYRRCGEAGWPWSTSPRKGTVYRRAGLGLCGTTSYPEAGGFLPHYTLAPASPTRDPEREFDLCSRCMVEPEIIRVVAVKKSGLALGSDANPAVIKVPHTSYDFAPRPIPCISCARILSADDD
jgi:hypothetical protein